MQTPVNQTKLFYYSPTGTSKKIAHAVCKGITSNQLSETDLTFMEAQAEQIHDNQLAIFVMPVYAGRIAPTALQRMSGIQGKNTPAVAIVVYGNRHYDDALLELCDVLKQQGFTPLRQRHLSANIVSAERKCLLLPVGQMSATSLLLHNSEKKLLRSYSLAISTRN